MPVNLWRLDGCCNCRLSHQQLSWGCKALVECLVGRTSDLQARESCKILRNRVAPAAAGVFASFAEVAAINFSNLAGQLCTHKMGASFRIACEVLIVYCCQVVVVWSFAPGLPTADLAS